MESTRRAVKPGSGKWVRGLALALLTGCGNGEPAPGPESAPPAGYEQGLTANPLLGHGACAWGSADCNPCVPDVTSAFNRLGHHGDVLGFHMNRWSTGMADVTVFHHWQGVQRLMPGNGQYLAISRSGAGQRLAVVKLGSRAPGGERLRSNRKHTSFFIQDTAPPPQDGIVKVLPQDEGYDHAGGMQALGNYLAVPMENGDAGRSKVTFYDMASPESPRLVHELDHSSVYGQGGGIGEAGTASLTKLSTGQFLLIVGRADARVLDVYVSSTTSLEQPGFVFFGTWRQSTSGLAGWGAYQNLNLVNQCDGTLFLVGTHNTGYGVALDDWADLYRLELDHVLHTIGLTKVANKHVYCDYNGTNHCNLDAAGGLYVAPDQSLVLYAAEHDNDGPLVTGGTKGGADGSVKIEEFRPNPHRSTCFSLGQAWVELFDDSGLQDRSLMVDYADRTLEDESNYDRFEGFEDKASSARWCLPPGWRYRLYANKNPCGGGTLDLVGTGYPRSNSNFGGNGFNDKASCSKWIYQP